MLYYTLKRLGLTETNVSWKSIGLSYTKFATPTTTDNSLSSSTKWYENSFKAGCLKQKKRNLYLYFSYENDFCYCLWIRYMIPIYKFWF